MSRPKREWTRDNDKHFGPFTFSRDSEPSYGVVIDSGGGMDANPYCHMRLYLRKTTLLIELPQFIQPWRQEKVFVRPDGTQGGYTEEFPREYGFSISMGGFFQLFLGAQTHDSQTTQNWCCHLPWTQWRHVRHVAMELDGSAVIADLEAERRDRGIGFYDWQRKELGPTLPTQVLEVEDYDCEVINVLCRVEERAWKFGTGWFKWLSWFRKDRVDRYVAMEFSSEFGSKKGSWKGGIVGASAVMRPEDTVLLAVTRWAKEHNANMVTGNIGE